MQYKHFFANLNLVVTILDFSSLRERSTLFLAANPLNTGMLIALHIISELTKMQEQLCSLFYFTLLSHNDRI
jgi:hypothetical protein